MHDESIGQSVETKERLEYSPKSKEDQSHLSSKFIMTQNTDYLKFDDFNDTMT